jgi:hypothetical protein
MLVMRALGQDESGAVDWLRSDSSTPKGSLSGRQFSATDMLELNDAAYWFYEAALHGRLFALGKYGEARGVIFGGPVGLGWIESADYEAVNSIEKAVLDPMNLHNALVLDLVPELGTGAASIFF